MGPCLLWRPHNFEFFLSRFGGFFVVMIPQKNRLSAPAVTRNTFSNVILTRIDRLSRLWNSSIFLTIRSPKSRRPGSLRAPKWSFAGIRRAETRLAFAHHCRGSRAAPHRATSLPPPRALIIFFFFFLYYFRHSSLFPRSCPQAHRRHTRTYKRAHTHTKTHNTHTHTSCYVRYIIYGLWWPSAALALPPCRRRRTLLLLLPLPGHSGIGSTWEGLIIPSTDPRRRGVATSWSRCTMLVRK